MCYYIFTMICFEMYQECLGLVWIDLFELIYWHRAVWLVCFWAYAKQIMQISKLLCIIHKLVYEKTDYEDTILLVRTYELTFKVIYLDKLFFINSKISQSEQAHKHFWDFFG